MDSLRICVAQRKDTHQLCTQRELLIRVPMARARAAALDTTTPLHMIATEGNLETAAHAPNKNYVCSLHLLLAITNVRRC